MNQYKQEREFLQSQIVDDSDQEDMIAAYAAVKQFFESDFKDLYHTLTPEEKRTMWRAVINKVIVRSGKIVDVDFVKKGS